MIKKHIFISVILVISIFNSSYANDDFNSVIESYNIYIEKQNKITDSKNSSQKEISEKDALRKQKEISEKDALRKQKEISEKNRIENEKILLKIKNKGFEKIKDFMHMKIIKKGIKIPNIKNKKIKFLFEERITGNYITIPLDENNPIITNSISIPEELLNIIDIIGIGGEAKVIIEPKGGYGIEGIPGRIPPNSMSFLEIKVLDAN
ncbi:hypothetical protein ACS5F0_004068 [Providencia rettgeri]